MNLLKSTSSRFFLLLSLMGFVMVTTSCSDDDVTDAKPAVVASFSATTTTITQFDSVKFTDKSTNSPDTWDWTFEGGTPDKSTEQNPTVTYSAAGTYQVKLIATRSSDKSSSTKEEAEYITVEASSEIKAAFSSTETSIKEGETVTFKDESINGADTWAWVFDGGTPSTSSDQNPTVTYASAGSYDVKLTVTNSTDQSTSVKVESGFVQVTDDNPQQPFEGKAQVIPGVLSVFKYDLGGEGIAFHDEEELNKNNDTPFDSPTLRRDEAVEIQLNPDNGLHNIGYGATGEWVEYTVDVKTTGKYSVVFDLASANGDGVIQLQQVQPDSTILEITPQVTTTVTDWQDFVQTSVNGVDLTKGRQVIRVQIVVGGANIRDFTFILE